MVPTNSYCVILISDCLKMDRSFLTLQEMVRWLGVSLFEIWLQCAAIFVFSILLTIRIETGFAISWWWIFSPLFIACSMQGYFTIIAFIRQYFEEETFKIAASRALLVGMMVSLQVTFEVLLCLTASGEKPQEGYALTFCPIYVVMSILVVKACLLYS